MFGYAGKILRVNLSKNRITEEKIAEEDAREFLGGRGLGAKILFDELKPGTDPLGPENKLVFATGPIVGTSLSCCSRYVVMAKSPLTGCWGEASAAGFFGPELKFAGYDAIIVEGQFEKPSYLWINDGEAEIRDASHLWGKDTGPVQRAVQEEVGEARARVACIGSGGENLVRFACIISDLHRAAGRTGLGAVMGSKKLKAIAVRGRQTINVADKEKLKELGYSVAREMETMSGDVLQKYGTSGFLDSFNASGRLPTMAFRKCQFQGSEKITGQTMAETILIRRSSCFACHVGCIRIVEADEPYKVNPSYGGPEYETCTSFGSLCMNDNLVSIAKANELCNRHTLDTMSTGVVIAFAMECYEKGLLTKESADGLDLTWGNHKAIIQLIEKIAKRDGIGKLLAEGVKRAAEKIGAGAEEFALHVKGLELPMHEVRGKKGLGLSFATSNRGACHLQSFHDDMLEDETRLYQKRGFGFDPSIAPRDRLYVGPEKAKLVKLGQDFMAFIDSAIFCKFFGFRGTEDTIVRVVNSVTGWDISPIELMTIGERIFNLCRAFNVREGITRKDDKLPKRLGQPLPEGPYEGEALPRNVLEKMLDSYYHLRGWSIKTGIPTQAKLEELGLEYAGNELKKRAHACM